MAMEEVVAGLIDVKGALEVHVASKDRVIHELRRRVDEEKPIQNVVVW